MPPSEHALRLALVVRRPPSAVGATFIDAHIRHLPFDVRPYFRSGWRTTRDRTAVWPRRTIRFGEVLSGLSPSIGQAAFARAFARELRHERIDAVLAEYGQVGVHVMAACRLAGIPLIVHFRGKDASNEKVLAQYLPRYKKMFAQAAAVIAVSREIRDRLESWGAPSDRLYVIPSGVDPGRFTGADPARVGPMFIAVGRFVAKKAPHLTIAAFARVVEREPAARLRMVGDGPLEDEVRTAIAEHGIEGQVELLGRLSSDEVAQLMAESRCFVQHSMTTPDGDTEGAPKTVSEAQMAGLPVVATRHAGIPELVIDGESAFLVEEGDVDQMAAAMIRIAQDPELAARMGRRARQHAVEHLALERSIGEIADVIQAAVDARRG